ncbi:MAG: gamma-glutamyltransferase, partial [Pseudomonadota bacterium]
MTKFTFQKRILAVFAGLAIVASSAVAEDTLTIKREIGAGGRPVGEIWSRSPVYAKHGMAATAHPLASQVAIDILKKGGNAADAAIAANAALGLMEPTGNGIGGDLFAIIWDPKSKKLYGLNASGRSPIGRSYEELVARLDGKGKLPPFGDIPVSVPGTVDGWFELHERFGNMSMRKVLQPAIDYANDGFPVSQVIAHYFKGNLARFESEMDSINEFDNARRTYFENGPPQEGTIFRNPDLAKTLTLIS